MNGGGPDHAAADRRRCAFVVRGRVQGVGFRYFTCNAATERAVSGWVRNAGDGSVVGEVEGEAAAVAAFLGDLRHGPRHARVDDLQVDDIAPTGASGFTAR